MRNKGSWLLAVLLCIATLTTVHAQASLDVVEPTLRVSLPPNAQETTSFTVKNDGTTNITLNFDTSQLDLTDSAGRKITLSFNPSNPTISVGQQQTISLDIQSEIGMSFEEFGGSLIVKDQGSSAQDTVDLIIDIQPDVCDFGQVGNDLRIDIKEPDSSDDFKPGESIRIEVDVDNEGTNDIRVQVDAFLFNEDGRNLADTSSTTKRIADGEDESFDLNLFIPFDPDEIDEDEDLTLYVKAYDDEFEQLNCVQDKQGIDIKLEKEEIIIEEEDSRLFPSVAACGDVVSATIKVVNIGEDDNDNVVISIDNTELGINERSDSFSIESFNSKEENTATRQFQLNIPPGITEKRYNMRAKVSFDGGSDTLTLPLDVTSCSLSAPSGSAGTPRAVTVRPLESSLSVEQGTIVSIPVQIENNQFVRAIFTVSAANVEDFADSTTKTVTLNPGTKTTTFLDLAVRESALAGTYSASIFVKEGANIVASTDVQVHLGDGEEAAQTAVTSPLVSGIPTSVWIIANVFLLAIVILSVKVVVTSLKRGYR